MLKTCFFFNAAIICQMPTMNAALPASPPTFSTSLFPSCATAKSPTACTGSSLSLFDNQLINLLPARTPVGNTLDLGDEIRKDRLRAIEDVVFALGLLIGNTARHLASTNKNLILVE